jgi:prepilin-type N-terminal cleavage/methylation domain-containing protein
MGRTDAGFTIIESLVAVTILAIVVTLTVGPISGAMRAIERSKQTTVAENLAQARIEEVRSLPYEDVGNIGFAPDGVLDASFTRAVENQSYTIDTEVTYVGSRTGLSIIPQGGDGVEGAFDPGVNYKYVVVTISSDSGNMSPLTMETIVAPPQIGALENTAFIEVTVDRNEPYDPYTDPNPTVVLEGQPPLAGTVLARNNDLVQFFAEMDEGTWEICLFGGSSCEEDGSGWFIHPDTLSGNDNEVDAVLGVTATRTIRVYQPASLELSLFDLPTGDPLTPTSITLTPSSGGSPVVFGPSEISGSVNTFNDLVPGRYDVSAGAPLHQSASVEVEVPGFGGGLLATASLSLDEQAFDPVDWTFRVRYAGSGTYDTAGATVNVTHATFGIFTGVTDYTGRVTIPIPKNTTGFTVVASTPWGHAPDSTTFNTGGGTGSRTLDLGKPGGTDRIYFRNGERGPAGIFAYNVDGAGWVPMPANDLGHASFIVEEDWGAPFSLRGYCTQADYDANNFYASVSASLNNNNRSWNVPGEGSC